MTDIKTMFKTNRLHLAVRVYSDITQSTLVSPAAVLRDVTQGALCDDPKNGCVGDQGPVSRNSRNSLNFPGPFSIFFKFIYSSANGNYWDMLHEIIKIKI